MRKLAIKKLKGSDLSFFKTYFTKHPQTKQKGFNLDAKLLEGKFYPGLKEQLNPLPKKAAHVDLTLMGPGLAAPYTLARKIKIDAKNFRLNGELVHDPEDQAGRFDILKVDDFALFEFGGNPLPDTVSAVLIAANHTEDAALHELFKLMLPNKTDSMCLVTEEKLNALIDAASPADGHPIRDWLSADLVEGVAVGDSAAVDVINKRRAGRGMSAAALKGAKATAERTGELGEELLDAYLSSAGLTQGISHAWTSQENAISPFDFLVTTADGQTRHVDAKSTAAKFETPLYLSTAEIRHALSSEVPYDIYRLYEVKETGANLRIARDIKKSLEDLQTALQALPKGVRVDSLAFEPKFFNFDAEVLRIDVDDSGDE